MQPHQHAALTNLRDAVKHHLHVRQVAEGQGLIPPLGGQGSPQAAQAAPGPQVPGQPPQPAQPQAPPPHSALPSKAPPPIDPTQVAAVQHRPRNAMLGSYGLAGRSAGAKAS
jgi:hypothetical protein